MSFADVRCEKCGHYMSKHKMVNRENSVCDECGCQLGPARRDDLLDEIDALKEELKKTKTFHRECIDAHKDHIQQLYEAAGADMSEGFETTEQAIEFVRSVRTKVNLLQEQNIRIRERLGWDESVYLADRINEHESLKVQLAEADKLWHDAEDKVYALENEVDRLEDEIARLKK